MEEENIMYQQLQKICWQKFCHIKVFQGNLGKILFAPQENPLLLHLQYDGR